MGLSANAIMLLGWCIVKGITRVPLPATGRMAFLMFINLLCVGLCGSTALKVDRITELVLRLKFSV